MDKKEVAELLDKYAKGICTKEEKILLESLYNEVLKKQSVDLQQIDFEAEKASIYRQLQPAPKPFKRFLPYVAAACVVLCISVIALYDVQEKATAPSAFTQTHDIAPGGNMATLTLADGEKITLDNGTQTALADQAGVRVVKSSNGQLIYTMIDDEQQQSRTTVFNVAETPKGGQYQLRLTDGTRVWLNASSSLKFPVKFVGNKRVVELEGEAYFDVAHQANQPFIVQTTHEQVHVLGTQFNVSAYPDEPAVTTTLIAGSVKVQAMHSGETALLNPGEQSLLNKGIFTVKEVDIEQAMAWKNGYFRFYDEQIESIMRKLARWYNIEEVSYIGKPSEELFTGKVSRFKNISQVLHMLEKTGGAHFKIEGRRVVVMP